MITAREYGLRRENLLDKLPDGSIAVLFCGQGRKKSGDENYDFEPNRNFYYLTGIDQENSTLILCKGIGDSKEFLFIDEKKPDVEKWTGIRLSPEEATDKSGIKNVLLTGSFAGKLETFLSGKGFDKFSKLFLDLEPENKIDLEVTTKDFKKTIEKAHPEITVENVYPLVAQLRMVKSQDEIEMIKEAIRTTEIGLLNAMKELKAGKYEWNMRNVFEFHVFEEQDAGLAFHSIVASGENATILHYPNPKGVLKNGDLILFDVGANRDYYSADISRTYPINGKYTMLQKKIYKIVYDCNKATQEFMRPGVTLDECKKFSKDFLAKECVAQGFIKSEDEITRVYYHGSTHHLGLDTHDAVDVYTKPLVPGNVITCEPGLYFKEYGIGIRLEDDILITPTGSINLSSDILKKVEDIEKFLATRK